MRTARQDQRDEQLDAVRMIGKIGGEDVIACLESAAARRPLFWRSRYEPVRVAAVRALAEIRARLSSGQERAA